MFNVVLTFYQDSVKLSTNYACKVQLIAVTVTLPSMNLKSAKFRHSVMQTASFNRKYFKISHFKI